MHDKKRPEIDDWSLGDALALYWTRISDYVINPVLRVVDALAEDFDYLLGGLEEFRRDNSIDAKHARDEKYHVG